MEGAALPATAVVVFVVVSASSTKSHLRNEIELSDVEHEAVEAEASSERTWMRASVVQTFAFVVVLRNLTPSGFRADVVLNSSNSFPL